MAAVGPQLRLLLQSGEAQTIDDQLNEELTILWVGHLQAQLPSLP
jgi:hypothetical protein